MWACLKPLLWWQSIRGKARIVEVCRGFEVGKVFRDSRRVLTWEIYQWRAIDATMHNAMLRRKSLIPLSSYKAFPCRICGATKTWLAFRTWKKSSNAAPCISLSCFTPCIAWPSPLVLDPHTLKAWAAFSVSGCARYDCNEWANAALRYCYSFLSREVSIVLYSCCRG